MTPRSVVLLLGWLAASVPLAAAQPTPTAPVVHLAVDPRVVAGSLPDDFVGFGYETSAVARPGYFSAANTALVQLYRTLGPRGVVRIGGIIGDHTRFEPDGPPVAHDQTATTVIDRAVLDDLGGFLRATGWQAIWTLNLGTGTKEEAAAEAVAVHAALGDKLLSFEIGNEVDNLRRFQRDYARYHAAYLDYKAAVRAALPTAVFSGPDVTANGLTWVETFARDEAHDTRLLLYHYYRTGARSPQATLETLLAPHPDLDDKLARLEALGTANHLAYRINEVNSFSGGGKPDVSDTFGSALWCLDFMFRVAAHGGAGVNMETDVNQLGFVSHYSPIFRDQRGELTARPEYYGLLAFSLAGHGRLVRLTLDEPAPGLTAYATVQDDGTTWVTVINKDLAHAANLALRLPPGGAAAAAAFRLSAPSVQSKTGVTLGGASVTAAGVWSPAAPEPLTVAKNTVTLAVPPASAVLVRLK